MRKAVARSLYVKLPLVLGSALWLSCSGSSDNPAFDDVDLAAPEDLAMAPPSDGAVTPDGAVSPDGAVTPDLRAPADLSAPADMVPAPKTVRFVGIGDTGKGNQGQKDVAKAIADKCALAGCDFIQLLGDNIYDSGVTGDTDPQWQTKFEQPYMAITQPFYVVLGNHDYGGDGAGWEFGKGAHQVRYTAKSMKWKLPANIYKRTVENVDFYGLDTNLIMWSREIDKQKMALSGWLAASAATWKIAFAHHPYKSNGKHGNAGTYEGIPGIPIVSGKTVKDFVDQNVCGKVDLYISGHDHSRQWLTDTCMGTELVVSGAGASTTELPGRNPSRWQANTLGFLYVAIEGRKLTAEFIDVNGKVEYTRILMK